MTDQERDYMAQSIRAAVAESIAPLAHRVTVLETRQDSAARLFWISATAVVGCIVASIYALIAGK